MLYDDYINIIIMNITVFKMWTVACLMCDNIKCIIIIIIN